MNTGLTACFTKRFPTGPVIAVDGLRIPARAGITVLFGTSGAGKTTVLRCLAGLERPEAGAIRFGEEVWSDAERNTFLAPRRRRVGFVPQEYALFPHLTVARNIAYGLHRETAARRHALVEETMQWLGIEGLGGRLPGELSGGQQQRVALARAVVTRPRLLLLDEPLSSLDAPTRLKVRTELRRLLVQSAVPTILVTHDRLDALALGDAMVVMDQGRILQQGPVQDVFSRPADVAVATIVSVETVQPGRVVEFTSGLVTVAVGNTVLTALDPGMPPDTREVYLCIRAEDVILTSGGDVNASPRNRLTGTVRALVNEGPMVRVELDCGFPLKALLTKQACEELSLRENAPVMVLIKAPQVHLIPR